MMQIDCEVTNTQLLHLQESVIPEHLRRNQQSADDGPKADTDRVPTAANGTKNYKPYFVKENFTDFNNKNDKNPYVMKTKDPYPSKEPSYLLRSKFLPNFVNENSKDDNYSLRSKNYVKPDVDGSKTVYSHSDKKFRRRRNLPNP